MPFPQTEKEGGEIVINICTICKGEIQEPPYLMAYGPQDREAYFHEHCWDANPGIVSGYTLGAIWMGFAGHYRPDRRQE
mgnify:CR=1 FL=1